MTTSPTARPTRAGKWLIGSAVALVLALTLFAFSLSYSVLQDLAARSGIPANVTWIWPLVVDGAIVVTMVVIFAQRGRGRGANALPWAALVLFALISVVGNGIHTAAVHDNSQGIPMYVAIGVGAVPPIALLVASEMLVRLLAPHDEPAADVVEAEVAVDLEPVHESVPAVETVHAAVPVLEVDVQRVPDADVAPEPLAKPGFPVVPDTEPTVESVPDVVSESAPVQEPADKSVSEVDVISEDKVVPAEPALAPLARLHAVEPDEAPVAEVVPSDKGAQIDWVIEQALAKEDVTRERISERLGVSVRTAQRRLAEARDKAPEAFEEPSVPEDLVKVS